jgi:uncharacterized damage-inducible protein DinB
MSTHPVADNFLSVAVRHMKLSQGEIVRCLDKLTEEQMSYRSGDYENSITNLLLHLEGNMRQWILHGIDGQPDVRRRDDEFTLALSTTAAEARASFNATLEESAQVIATLDQSRLLEVIDPQPTGTWRHCTVLDAIVKVMAHLAHHSGQIILLTKQRTASDLGLSMPRKR